MYTKDESFFTKPSIINSYWAGFIAADGCVRKNQLQFKLSNKDKNVLDNFKQVSKCENPIQIYRENNKLANNDAYEFCYLNVTCSKWILDLNKTYNIVPKKSLTLNPPNIYDDKLILSYIVGYIDGDGSISVWKDKNRNGYVRKEIVIVGTESLLNWIKKYIETKYVHAIKYGGKLSNVRRKGSIFYYKISGNRLKSLLKDVLELDIFKLERKWSKLYE